MTVAELIERLKTLPQDLEVVTESDHTCRDVCGAGMAEMEWPGSFEIQPVVSITRSNREMGFIS